jgi:GT2 family glycosyltransferase
MIDIVIVNWNAGALLAETVTSIQRFHGNCVTSVVIVDNASIDDSLSRVEAIPDLAFELTLIRSHENHGFGQACNLGARRSQGKYILFLNPDSALYADSLPKALAFMQDPINADIGICGVQLLNEAGGIARSCARFPTSTGLVVHALGLDRIFPVLGHAMADWNHTQTRRVDHVIGAFFFVRRTLFDALQGFDPRFFVYLEDLDFSFRARRAGWRTMYLADTQAFHAGGGTSAQVKAHRLFYSLRSRILYAFKHLPRIGAIGVLLTTLLVEPLSRSILALLRRSWSAATETWRAYSMLWRWLPRWLFKGETH